LDFSILFKECVAKNKNLQGILENGTPALIYVLFFKIPILYISHDTYWVLWEKLNNKIQVLIFMFNKTLDHGIYQNWVPSVQLHLVEVVNLAKFWAKALPHTKLCIRLLCM
jgi:hypothetical protein